MEPPRPEEQKMTTAAQMWACLTADEKRNAVMHSMQIVWGGGKRPLDANLEWLAGKDVVETDEITEYLAATTRPR